jgi:DinB superfamily
MKKILAFTAVLLFISTTSFIATAPSTLSKEERKYAAGLLKETKKYFLKNTKGLSDAQLDFKASPEKWSIRQCMEHIALSESFLDQMLQGVLNAPANPEKRAEIKITDEQIPVMLVDRSKKAQAPEPIQPKGSFKSADEAIQQFTTARDKHIEYMKTTQDDMRNHCAPHPAFGMMDSYQWMLLVAAHAKRHTLQIEEVKASPGYPQQ